MIPLQFIILITGISVFISHHLSTEVTWFTYYIGGVAGLLGSGFALEFWNRRKRKAEK